MKEDNMELSPKFKKQLEEARQQIKEGKVVSFEEIKKKLKKNRKDL